MVLGFFSFGESTPTGHGGLGSGVWRGWLAAAGLGDVSVGWKKGGAVEVVQGPCSFIESSCRRAAAAGLCGHLQHEAVLPLRRCVVRRRRRRLGVLGQRRIIVNTAAELEPGVLAAIADGRCTRGVHGPTVYPIGPAISITPPAEEQPHECVRWLDSQPPASVLFVCFGSKGLLSASQVHEIAHGLERSGHRFLWVLRGLPQDATQGAREPTDANLAEALPEGFLERTKEKGMVWPKRAPQKEILGHASAGGFVTHCGWNSILESLWFGVPMLPWPLDADQHLNAFALVHGMGMAVPLEMDRKQGRNYVEAAELERAVTSLMGGSEEGRKAKEKATEMKAVCRKAVQQSGSSCASLQRLSEELLRGAVLPKK